MPAFVFKYISSLKFFILAALIIFVLSVFQGYFFAQNSPGQMWEILEKLQERLEPVIDLPPFSQFLFIILNNGIIAFLAVFLGLVFGIFPFLVLFSNGIILGIMAYFTTALTDFGTGSWRFFLTGILPHGIIEIPAIILSSAIGLHLGKTLFFRIIKKEGSVKLELNNALSFFIKILFPLLVLASAIEVFITAQLL